MPAADAATINEVADELFAAIERSDETMLNRLFDDDIAAWRVGARRNDDTRSSTAAFPRRFRPAAHSARHRPRRRNDRPTGVQRD